MVKKMKKKKIMLCFGTRPEALKMASLVLDLKNHPRLKPIVVLTAQHRQMSDQVMKLFGLKSHYDLILMTENQTLASLSERLIKSLDPLLQKTKPDCLLVQGDTTTAFLAALASFYHKVPVGHIEAGLRTDDRYQPFPEEINRRLITQVAEFNFAPTQIAAKRLLKEGVSSKNIIQTGNTGIDALFIMKRILEKRKTPPLKFPKNKKIVLVTAHRRESFGKPIKNICLAIRKIAERFPEAEIYYPVHLNPNIQKPVKEILKKNPQIHLIKPLAYDALVYAMSRADLILTDSGGIQEEAPSFYKPILVMRNVTERPEGVKAGFSRIVGQNPDKILREATKILKNPREIRKLKGKPNPYGDGKASKRIVKFLAQKL